MAKVGDLNSPTAYVTETNRAIITINIQMKDDENILAHSMVNRQLIILPLYSSK